VVGRLKLLEDGGNRGGDGGAEERWFTAGVRARHPERVAQRMAELLANDLQSYTAAYTGFSRPAILATGWARSAIRPWSRPARTMSAPTPAWRG
jgi:hypothetical protein